MQSRRIQGSHNGAPKFLTVLTRDWGTFLATFGPLIMASAAFVVYLADILRGALPDASISDVLNFAMLIPISGFAFSPAVVWWYYVIRRTFAVGQVVDGEIIKIDRRFIYSIGLTYRAVLDGREIVGIADFVNRKIVRQLAERRQVKVVVDPRRNISFIKDLLAQRQRSTMSSKIKKREIKKIAWCKAPPNAELVCAPRRISAARTTISTPLRLHRLATTQRRLV